MKILLVNPLIRKWALPNCVPSGLLYLSAVSRQAGHQVDLLDWNGLRWSEGQIEKYIEKADYDLLGTGGIVTTYNKVKWILNIAKKYHPRIPAIVGGPLATSSPKIVLQQTEADIVCVGEGERTILEVVENLEGSESLKCNVLIEDLDSIPSPDYENLGTLEVYARNPIGFLNKRKWRDGQPTSNMRSLNIVTSRGCPYSCNFCFSKYLGHRYRTRSVSNVIDEMELLVNRYKCEYIHFTDELTFTPLRAIAFCKELERRGLQVLWGGAFRIDLGFEDLFKRMRDCGCVHLGCGIESFSPEVLKAMNKRVDPSIVKRNLVLARGIIEEVDTSFILGYPTETRQTIQETLRSCKEIDLVPGCIFFATPYPGTELYKVALARGLVRDEAQFLESLGEQGELPLVNFTDIPTEELLGIKRRWLEDEA